MIGDTVVVDAVVHPYNLPPANQNPATAQQLEAVYKAHAASTATLWMPDRLRLDERRR